MKGIHQVPLEQSINMEYLSELWDYCFVIRIDDAKRDSKYDYSYIGEKIIEAYQGELSHEDMELIPLISPLIEKINKQLEHVVERKRPLISENMFVNTLTQLVKYRQCLLPFSDNGETVDMIFGGMRYKIAHTLDEY